MATDARGRAGEGNAEGGAEDVVAGVLRQWQQVHPGLDTESMAVIGRINRCSALLQQAADAPLIAEGLSRAEFEILGTLRRMDRELTPGRIARETFASGAAVTKRVRELERRGLLARRPDTRDRRVAHLTLTGEGKALIDRLLPEQLRYERSLLSGVGPEQRAQLSAGLSELLVVLEGRLGSVMP